MLCLRNSRSGKIGWCFLCAQHWARLCARSLTDLSQWIFIMILWHIWYSFVLQMRKLGLREEKWLPQSHIASMPVAGPGAKWHLSSCKPKHFLAHSSFPRGVTRGELKGWRRRWNVWSSQKALRWPSSCSALPWPWAWKGQRSRLPWCSVMSQEERQLSGKQLVFLQQPGKGDKQINADTRLHLMS